MTVICDDITLYDDMVMVMMMMITIKAGMTISQDDGMEWTEKERNEYRNTMKLYAIIVVKHIYHFHIYIIIICDININTKRQNATVDKCYVELLSYYCIM